MIQFNLLPDVKVQFIKAQKSKRMVFIISILAVVVSVTLLLIMVSATAFQKRHISDLNKDIKTYENKLQGTNDLAKILTIQNQLNSLPNLYKARPATSRIFSYIQATTPAQVSISSLTLDFGSTSLSVRGSADSLEAVNRYVDTLKFTTYSVKDSEEKIAPFSGVVLTSFSREPKTVSYSVNFIFDATIFDASKAVTLNVPKLITTRSETQLPSSSIFDTKAAQ